MVDPVDGEQEARDAHAARVRRRRRAVVASLAIHGVLGWLALSIPPSAVVDEPRPAVLTTIDVELGPRPPERPQLLAAIAQPGGAGTPSPARSTLPAGARGRR
ncbi:MAG TPA: hypothetical protein VK932_10550, partial [Kofleriaceae bacterium]|nr:hypothetical protein [Kofleriaceae bacterium]